MSGRFTNQKFGKYEIEYHYDQMRTRNEILFLGNKTDEIGNKFLEDKRLIGTSIKNSHNLYIFNLGECSISLQTINNKTEIIIINSNKIKRSEAINILEEILN